MMRWRINFGIALLLSAAFHVALLMATPSLWRGWSGGTPKPTVQHEITVALEVPEPKASLPPEFEMGLNKATGYGSNAATGEEPLKAREAEEDQALLSRAPHSSGRLIDDPTRDLTLPGENGLGGQQGVAAAQVTMPTPAPASEKTPPQVEAVAPMPHTIELPRAAAEETSLSVATIPEPSVELPKLDPKPSPPVPPARQPLAVAMTPHPQAPPPQAQQRPQTGDGRAPGVDPRQSDPAQKSDSESDPFAKVGSAVFRDGRLEVREGRKVKTTRPHILLAGQFDLLSKGTATVVLKIALDRTGKVTAVDVVQSSGSNDIDQPCRVAVYEWWFEPSHDKQGNPVADSITFTIRFE